MMSNQEAKIPEANYTQIPNVIFDSMSEMGDAEFRVVLAIARKTFGWQKTRDKLSLSQLRDLTGLSRQGVLNGVEAAISNKWIGRSPAGDSFEYFLLVNEVDNPLVNLVDQTSQPSRPEVVNLVDTQKKELKKLFKENDSRKRERPAPPPELLITSIKHGEELQAELNRTFESKNRKAPIYFENVLQKEAYQSAAESLNGKFMTAVTTSLGRGRESRRDLLASLQAWVKNEKGQPHGQYRQSSTGRQVGNAVSPEAAAVARYLDSNS